jgi:hypothetical protein
MKKDKFTELDNKAWELLEEKRTEYTMLKNKHFFVYHKDSYPYCLYYHDSKKQGKQT